MDSTRNRGAVREWNDRIIFLRKIIPVAAVKKPRAKKTASAEELNGPVTRPVELELF